MFTGGFLKSAEVKVIKELGKGGEGIAHLVDHPEHGRVVRKTYNIAGKLFSKPIFEKKLEILKKVKSPYLPRFFGQEGDKPVTYHEYVKFKKQKGAPTKEREGAIAALNKQIKNKTGVTAYDLANDNFVKDENDSYKAIDFMIDGPIKKTSRRGQIRAAGKWAETKAEKEGFAPKAVKKSLMAQMRARFDSDVTKHKSRQQIMRNAELSRGERDKLIQKATNWE